MAARVGIPPHYRDIFRFVRRRVGTVEDAEDTTQEVFADAAAALAKSETTAPPTLAWLYTVARRRIVDRQRRQGQLGRKWPLQSVDTATEDDEYGTLVAEALATGLGTMPSGQRDVVVGRLLHGRSFADLSQALDVSEEACRMRFMRGLRHLRESFEKEGLTP